MRYYLLAGEPSGDQYGRELADALRAADPEAQIRFRSSAEMVSVMGIAEVASHLGAIARTAREVKRELRSFAPDIFIPIDYPGFNLRMARYAHARGIRVYYYIAPKLWARNEKRITRIQRDVDRLYVLFPFETEYFGRFGVEARYLGNPLGERIAQQAESEPFRQAPNKRTIALLPGSRSHEIAWLTPRYSELEKLMRADRRWDHYELVIAAAPGRTAADYRPYLAPESRIRVVTGCTHALLKAADAAVVCSGTASLEAALLGTPQLVCYGFHPLTWWIARKTVKVRWASLPNLILNRLAVTELLQGDATPSKMLAELARITFDDSARAQMTADFDALRGLLSRPGCVAQIAQDIVRK